jgi:hypothetical protein
MSLALTGDYLIAAAEIPGRQVQRCRAGFCLGRLGQSDLERYRSPGLEAKARIPALPVRTLLRYWPIPVAAGARSWIDENIFAGDMGPLEAQANFRARHAGPAGAAGGIAQADLRYEEQLRAIMWKHDPSHRRDGRRHPNRDTFKALFSSAVSGPWPPAAARP